jgi:ABC-type Fe3+ transport system substrate-binding protein
VVAYNKQLISDEKVPSNWEGFLSPEFKGKKFVTDIRPLGIAGLVPSWGVQKTVEFARKLAAQEPIWVRGGAPVLNAVAAGEYALFMGVNYGAVKRAEAKDRAGRLAYKVVEPVPVRFASTEGILARAQNPHAALLWLEFQASAEGQKIIDQHWPYGASVFVSGSAQEKVVAGKALSVMSWELQNEMEEWLNKVVEAYGFPKEEKRR